MWNTRSSVPMSYSRSGTQWTSIWMSPTSKPTLQRPTWISWTTGQARMPGRVWRRPRPQVRAGRALHRQLERVARDLRLQPERVDLHLRLERVGRALHLLLERVDLHLQLERVGRAHQHLQAKVLAKALHRQEGKAHPLLPRVLARVRHLREARVLQHQRRVVAKARQRQEARARQHQQKVLEKALQHQQEAKARAPQLHQAREVHQAAGQAEAQRPPTRSGDERRHATSNSCLAASVHPRVTCCGPQVEKRRTRTWRRWKRRPLRCHASKRLSVAQARCCSTPALARWRPSRV
mmetsp:Transcript_3039/g.8793  ORF Transcript_3039/g.8793 Transcript_3039/m.8793 type:complete len:294 (+) Transcript_3039:1709-2590(+)